MPRNHGVLWPTGLMIAALLASGVSRPLPAQQSAPRELGKRTGRSPFAFGFLFSVGELPDGRVVAADSKERVYRIVDFAKSDMPVLGEPGDDSLQYRFAGPILPWRGDSLLLYVGLRGDPRYLHVSPAGEIVDVTVGGSPSPPEGPPKGGILSVSGPNGLDSDGTAYFTIELRDSTLTSFELADVLQLSADGTKRTIVDYLRTRRKDQVYPWDGHSTLLRPFDFADAWTIRQDGLAARVVADTYEVVWSRNGKEIGRTGPLPFTPILINAAEQTAYRDSMIDRFNPKPAADGGKAPTQVAGGGGGRAVSSSSATTGDNNPRSFTPPPATTSVRIPNFAPFPDRKPAIPNPRWQRVAFFAPDGRLWVVRERAHGDDIPHIDIIEEGRGVVGHVNLPRNLILVGFGAKSVYLVNRGGDGDWLERYPMPVIP